MKWSDIGSRHFTAGLDRGVLFLQNGSGVPWNGLLAVNETPSGSDVVEGYYDGLKFFSRRQVEGFSATIEAVTYPLEFDEYDGQVGKFSNQRRKMFGFSYRTLLGDDVAGLGEDYLIHIVYNATASPSQKDYKSVSSDSDLVTFSWAVDTMPQEISDRYGSHLIINTKIAYPWAVEALESLLYGSASVDSSLPSPSQVLDLFEDSAILKITNHGDGTWTAEGPDEAIIMLDATTFQITWPSAVYINSDSYTITSL